MVTTASPCDAAAAADVAATAPSATSASRLERTTSNTCSACPAFTRLRAMGPPMLPNPMNAIFISG